jgi:DNA (cytosine-5)-methyltransferase 1
VNSQKPVVMKQTSIMRFTNSVALEPDTEIFDLFCGIGGFSCGAKQAGHRVVFACDSDPFLLNCHIRNNVDCEHWCCSLPRDDLPFPTSGRWHLHGSPPCTKLSIMQPLQYKTDQDNAIDLVAWFFSLVKEKKPTSWSFEQVNHKAIRAQLETLKAKHPLIFDWMVVDVVNFEVPQHRKRIIAATPSIIDHLRSFKSGKHKQCVLDVIPYPPRQFIKNSLYSRPHEKTRERVDVPLKDKIRSVDRPSYTILASGHKKWADEHGTVLRHLTGAEGALIQSFPADYKLPWSKTRSLIGVGNALPPQLAKVMMKPSAPESW